MKFRKFTLLSKKYHVVELFYSANCIISHKALCTINYVKNKCLYKVILASIILTSVILPSVFLQMPFGQVAF